MKRPSLQKREDGATVEQACRLQLAICRHMGGELYARLLEHCADEPSVLHEITGDWAGDVMADFVPLRVLGGVHWLVLAGELPQLAKHYPSTGGSPSFPGAWYAFRDALETRREFLREFLTTTPQTNEIARSAALATGFHAVALQFGLPLRLRELGASAGLNLLFDRYAFEFGDARWGEPGDRPVLKPEWSGAPPPLARELSIESRAGCDLSPIDVSDNAKTARLLAYVWPDQPERLQRLRRALELAREQPPRLERAPAGEWIERELASLPEGTTTVVYHSSFWDYLASEERTRISTQIEQAAARSGPTRALAWLRLEAVGARFELQLSTWPGGEERQLAESDAHGRFIRWQGDAA